MVLKKKIMQYIMLLKSFFFLEKIFYLYIYCFLKRAIKSKLMNYYLKPKIIKVFSSKNIMKKERIYIEIKKFHYFDYKNRFYLIYRN